MTRTMAWGAAMVGIAGLAWATSPDEIVWCGSLGVGFLACAAGLFLGGRAGLLTLTAGAILATVGGTHYVAAALAAGRPLGAWSIVGAGTVAASIAALAYGAIPSRRAGTSWAFPFAFGLVLVGLGKDASRGLGFDLWSGVTVTALAGAALLAFRSGAAYHEALDPARAAS